MVNPFTRVFFGLTVGVGLSNVIILGIGFSFFHLGHYYQLFLCSVAFPFVKVGWLVGQNKQKKIKGKK